MKEIAKDKAENWTKAYPIDRLLHAFIAKFTLGISPASVSLAFTDWLLHLSGSPGKLNELNEKYQRNLSRFGYYLLNYFLKKENKCCIEPLPQDHRFSSESWQQPPFNFIYQGFLSTQQWWHVATTGIRGFSRHHEQVTSFIMRQCLDIFSPSNFLLTNPEVLRTTLKEQGKNLQRGFRYLQDDLRRQYFDLKPAGTERYVVGKNIAITPGKVIYKNELIELIQYLPAKNKVFAEPILITPAWIMKYYILDLSPHNSLVKYLVDKGHTVFMISWKNPTGKDRYWSFDDYRRLGLMAALAVVHDVIPNKNIHAVGYCIGGTLLAIAAAAMANQNDHRIKTISLFAAQTDFREAGELMIFIDDSQVSWLKDMMWEQGYLSKAQMAGAFQLLRSNDLIFSRMQQRYLLGKRAKMTDLMAWNADATRVPYRMHSEYLTSLFLNNDFADGRLIIDGKVAALTNIKTPISAIATERDHVAPWKSVYKIHLLTNTDITFILTSGGHNAGIVSRLDHPNRIYRIHTMKKDESYISPERWLEETDPHKGSWWPAWQKWLKSHSSKRMISPPKVGNPHKGYKILYDAPGCYVRED